MSSMPPQIEPNTRVRVVLADLCKPNGVDVRPARVQYLHNDIFEQAYSWRLRPPVYRFCVVYDDGAQEVRQWLDARCIHPL